MDFVTTWATGVLLVAVMVIVGAMVLFAFVSFVTLVGMILGALALPSEKAA